MLLGYARVSTDNQDTAVQVAALRRAGVRRVATEVRMGAGVHRPVLASILARIKPGDVLCVYKVDRLARSLSDLLRIVSEVEAAGAGFRSLTEAFDTSTPAGRLMLQLLGAFAEWERAMIRERCELGRVEARARGVRFGRPRSFDYAEALRLRATGISWARVAAAVGSNRHTVRWALRSLL